MKYIKTYELQKYRRRPKIGDYVYCKDGSAIEDLNNFIKSNVGKIIDIKIFKNKILYYVVQYYHIPENIKTYFCYDNTMLEQNRHYHSDSIVELAKDKEDLKIFTDINKYNL